MTLWENEITAIVEMRRKGRTFSYISEEIRVCRDVIIRELAVLGIATTRVQIGSTGRQGPWFLALLRLTRLFASLVKTKLAFPNGGPLAPALAPMARAFAEDVVEAPSPSRPVGVK